MQTKITIRNEAQTCYIDIEGTIGMPEEQQGGDSGARVTTYEKFRREVARISEVAASAVVVNIRSTGGDVNDALLIYEALRSLGARITTRCYGYTASAATVIAQAADEGCREISTNALYLIHNSECAVEGNARTLASRAELLRKTDARLAELYAQRSGRDKESFEALMAENSGSGRWLTAEEAVAAGLADRIFDGVMTGAVMPEGTPLPPQQGDGDLAAAQPGTAASDGGAAAVESVAAPAAPAAPAAVPTARAKRPDTAGGIDDATEKALTTVAVSVAKCAVRRFARCWDNFLERVRSRREERRAEREAKAAEKAATSAAKGADDAAAAAETGAAMPRNAASPSVVAFEQGQRRYGPTLTAATEDPSAEPLRSETNARAYSDDARAFASMR